MASVPFSFALVSDLPKAKLSKLSLLGGMVREAMEHRAQEMCTDTLSPFIGEALFI